MPNSKATLDFFRKSTSITFIFCALAIPATAGAADQPKDLDLTPVNLNVPTKEGSSYINTILNSVKGLNDYTFDSEIVTYKKNNVLTATGKFFYKPLNLVRIEVTGKGYKAGSVLVKRPDGKVRARGGNALAALKLTLDEDSRMLQLPNGLNVVRSDYLHLVAGLKDAISRGGKCSVSQTPVAISYLNDKVTVVDVTAPDRADTLWQRVYVKPDLHLPVAWDIYNSGKLFSRAKFLNVKPNVGLTDDLFQL